MFTKKATSEKRDRKLEIALKCLEKLAEEGDWEARGAMEEIREVDVPEKERVTLVSFG